MTTPVGDRPGDAGARPPLEPGAGMNSIQLSIQTTRDELASTLDDLFAKFNLRLIATSRPVLFAAVVSVTGIAAAFVVSARRRARRGRG